MSMIISQIPVRHADDRAPGCKAARKSGDLEMSLGKASCGMEAEERLLCKVDIWIGQP